MTRHTDAPNQGALSDAGLLWISKAGSALSVAVADWFHKPLRPGASTHPIFQAPPDRLLRASRILLFPDKLFQLWRLSFLRPYTGNREHPDRFFYFVHKHYLSKRFSLRQRITCAVYHSPEGLTLWRRDIDGTRYTICLRASESFRHEGDLSVICLVDDVRVCRICFSYVRGALFGVDAPATVFVTRNQSDRNAALARFRADFKQNSPPYFCLAAVFGIAMAHGLRNIFMVEDEAQIAYEPRHAQSFKNSYSDFWRAFGAKELEDYGAFTMTVPPELNPISTVKHKARAAARRQNWLEIMVNARQAILPHRVNSSPPPIDVEAATLIRAPALPSHPLRAPRNEIETTCLDS
jgi:hypothetical protein